MHRITTFAFYELGQTTHPLFSIKVGDKIDTWRNQLQQALSYVEVTSSAEILGLKLSREPSNRLSDAIKYLLGLPKEEIVMTPMLNELRQALFDFEAVLRAEVNGAATYIVPQRAHFSTPTLVDEGEKMFPPEVLIKMSPLAVSDVKQGARCFAFELPTAAAFHFLRAVEEVIHQHYDVLAGGIPRPNRSAMGIYINKLIELNAQPEIVSVLKQIKDLHRNPINHPDAVVDMPGAQMIMGLMQSAIFAMMKVVPMPKPPTAIPGIPGLDP